MEYKIQSIIFPTEAKHQQCRKLFYRGTNGYLNRKNKELVLGKGQTSRFCTYFNACSWQKWQKYTAAKSLKLYLEVEGEVSLTFLGFHKELMNIIRNEFAVIEDKNSGKRTIIYDFPENNEQMVGFEISAISDCTLYGGYYTVDVDKSEVNDVNLSIATTTMKKEDFIKGNIELLKKEILDTDMEMKEHFFVHVVDNGRTLTEDDINGYHVYLHPNKNVGGSGGYSRGMMESLHQEPKVTHVLLMDDDVKVLPESIIRTYNLLKLLRPEYKEHFISGAMLYYERPEIQQEDVGYVKWDGTFEPLKPELNHTLLADDLEGEKEYAYNPNEYSAWWYCVIPRETIEKNGYSLPLFIRGDDVEYSLRCKAKHITMNAICVWHMGFITKYNAAMNVYQECRNELIDKACNGGDIMKDCNILHLVTIKRYREALLQFNYNTAELALRAFRDYLAGPEFIMEDRGEAIVKENVKLNDDMQPLETFGNYTFRYAGDVYADAPRGVLKKLLYRISYNGQRWIPMSWVKKSPAVVSFDGNYQPGTIALHDSVLAVNPYNNTAVMRKLDREKYRNLQKELKRLMKIYKKDGAKIAEQYHQQFKYLTSEEFWVKYLEL